MRRRYLIGPAVAVIAIASTAGGMTVFAMSGGGDVTGPEADAAAQAALEIVGGGTVLEVEHGDDAAAVWEVEVRKSDGEEVEVLLDGQLARLGVFLNNDVNDGPDNDSDGDEGPDDGDATTQ